MIPEQMSIYGLCINQVRSDGGSKDGKLDLEGGSVYSTASECIMVSVGLSVLRE